MSQPEAQQPVKLQKKRIPAPRVNRRSAMHLEEGDAHMWAVSYSDLLMVLMSFFVIYFSFDSPTKSQNGLLNIALAMKSPAQVEKAATGNGTAAGLNADLRKKFEDMHLKIEGPGNALILQFEPDIFDPGEFTLSESTKNRLREISKLVKPFEKSVDVVVIGHSDSKKVTRHKSRWLSNNFDLSSLRALKALQFMLDLGFPTDQISVQGAGENIRNSRSLSLRIQMRGKST